MTKKLRGPVKRHGGKTYLARRIIALFPPHGVYCEPFLGGGSVLLNKPPAAEEHAGDLDETLMYLWIALRDEGRTLARVAREFPYTEGQFREAQAWLSAEDPLVRAAGFLVRNRFSRGGLGKDFAWSDRLRGGQPGDANAWDTIREELPAISDRIRDVRLYRREAIDLMRSCDGPDTLHYLDPPYVPATRTAREAYAHEMTVEQHADLLEAVKRLRGKVFLSGYRNPLYDEALVGWHRHEFDMPNHSGQGKTKQRRVECLWEAPCSPHA